MGTLIFRLIILAVGVVALSCGEGDTPTATSPFTFDSTDIEYPVVIETKRGFSMTYPCSYMLHTFYTGPDRNKEEALERLKTELSGLVSGRLLEIPDGVVHHGPTPLDIIHSTENLTDLLMECHWDILREEDDDQSFIDWQQKEAERMEDIQRQLREYDALQHYYTPTPTP